MTEEGSKDDKLFEEALDLVIRLHDNPANPVTRDLVRCWRARGPDYEAAWAEVAEIHGMAGKVLEDRQVARPTRGAMSRRNVIRGAMAVAVTTGTGTLFGPDLLLRARADHVTATAELRRIPLADGTLVTLGPDSAIRSALVRNLRRVRLLAGMALFEVAPDAAHPFRAIANGLTVTGSDTTFSLSSDAGYITVSVDRGRVEATMPASPLAGGETLVTDDWMTVDEGALGMERGTRAPGEIAAWRDGMIVADREMVASVVARIARWQPGRVVFADPGLGERRISGVFNLDDPIAALQAVIQPHGGTVRQITRWLTILSPI